MRNANVNMTRRTSVERAVSQGLMAAIPTLAVRARRLAQIPGAVPRLSAIPRGCAFAPRCPRVFERCAERPPLIAVGERGAACWLYDRASAAADVRN